MRKIIHFAIHQPLFVFLLLLLFIGAGSLCSLFERRYIAYRFFLPSAAVWFAILLVASFFNLNNFISGKPSVVVFFASVPLVILATLGMFAIMEHRRTRTALAQPTLAQNMQ